MKKVFSILASLGLILSASAANQFVGEYEGSIKTEGHHFTVNPKAQAQVSKCDDKTYQVIIVPYLYRRAVPYVSVKIADVGQSDSLNFDVNGYKGEVKADGTIIVTGNRDKKDFVMTLKKFDRKIPTMGKSAPRGASILIGAGNMSEWANSDGSECAWKILGDVVEIPSEVAVAGKKKKNHTIFSKKAFGSFALHLEFKLPESYHKGWGNRGNSGLYIGETELQIIDSFAGIGTWNECGALYKFMPPKVNAALPPEVWQAYDVEYTAAKFENGKLIAYPRISVWHNGIKIHDDIEITQATDHSQLRAESYKFTSEKEKLSLQDHNDSLQFRNMWIQEK